MKISMGSDHRGYTLKEKLKHHLELWGFEVSDFGAFDTEAVDYPVYAKKVSLSVARGEAELGILICGTGIGMAIAANKHKGIRAANCSDTYSARMARLHNDANILTIGECVVGEGVATDIVKTFVSTEFEGGRHSGRVDILNSL